MNIKLVPQLSGLTEIWLDVPNYKGLYKVSNFGNVKSLDRRVANIKRKGSRLVKGKLLTPQNDGRGYMNLYLSSNGVKTKFKVHQIVALAFIPNPDNKPIVNHINGVKDDNRLINLEWSTASENCLHAFKTGLRKHSGGNYSTLSNVTILEIKRLLFETQLTHKEIAQRCGVSKATVGRINTGKIKRLEEVPYFLYCSNWNNLIKYYQQKERA